MRLLVKRQENVFNSRNILSIKTDPGMTEKKELLTPIITMCKYLKENINIMKREMDNVKRARDKNI